MNPTQPLKHAPSAQDILDARERIAPYVHQTPTFTSERFDDRAGVHCIFKGEHLQKTGSFKARGAMNAVLVHLEQARGKGFLTHSSGNHGAALAWAAAKVGEPAYIVMPSNAPKSKIEAVKAYGGIITFCEPTLEAREATAAEVESQTGALLIPPYDHYDIIAGQATATLELLETHPHIEYLFVPVGGGGLLAGAALANAYFGRAKVIGCEPEQVNDAYLSFNTGVWTPAPHAPTIADGLRTSLGQRNFPIIRKHVWRIDTVSEDQMKQSWSYTMATLKQFIEPSAASGLASVLNIGKTLRGVSNETLCTVGVVLCGGNMDIKSPFV